jgi:hypothetical protein
MSWFGSEVGDAAKDVGTGISSVTQGIRHMFTGDIPPQIALELDKIDLEANKLVTQRWISDNGAGWAKYVRPFGFLFVLIPFVVLIVLDGVTSIAVDPVSINSLLGLLQIMMPAYYGFRTIEKIKGVTK